MSLNSVQEEVYNRAKNQLEGKNELPELTDFSEIGCGAEEKCASQPMKKLFRRLSFIEKNNSLMHSMNTDSQSYVKGVIKKIMYKLTQFMFDPLVTKQNEINIETALLLGEMLSEMDRLVKENEDLKLALKEKEL